MRDTILLGHIIKAQERRHAARDKNRVVRPFGWGAEFVAEHLNGDDPREVVSAFSREAVRHSEEFYALTPVSDHTLEGDRLIWTSAVRTPSDENNTARARFFPEPPPKRPAKGGGEAARRAVVVLPQWNADAESHVALCRVLNRFGMAALRLTLPYHEERRPAGLERADFLVSPNVGRTLQSMRQAVVDTRAAVAWLRARGYGRVGVAGTSIGSCTAFLAFVHDEQIDAGVFNHVSGYVADVVWRGISTQHVRAGIEGALSLEELRKLWLPISPLAFADRLRGQRARPMRFIAARHDLTFPEDLSRDVIERVRRSGLPLDVQWLPCGHYTSGERPWVYLDAWKIVSFLRRSL
ncbi:MAG TPA: alpha/beta hydrolase family protein [Pyrinomonadaceae bacterium]|nr:alpha/beta hydrolase family protein [Pyrinomonadaceae bacterium]